MEKYAKIKPKSVSTLSKPFSGVTERSSGESGKKPK